MSPHEFLAVGWCCGEEAIEDRKCSPISGVTTQTRAMIVRLTRRGPFVIRRRANSLLSCGIGVFAGPFFVVVEGGEVVKDAVGWSTEVLVGDKIGPTLVRVDHLFALENVGVTMGLYCASRDREDGVST